jgi:hypothetical protein
MRKIVLSLIGIVIVVGAVLTVRHFDVKPKSNPSPIASASPQVFATVTYQGVTGQTAMDLLKASHKVETQHYSFGDLVTSIDGQSSDTTKYWLFYVNGKAATVGADAFKTTTGQTIEWKLEAAQ